MYYNYIMYMQVYGCPEKKKKKKEKKKRYICDVIKRNQLELGNTDFKIQPNMQKMSSVSYCFWQLTNFNGVFFKM